MPSGAPFTDRYRLNLTRRLATLIATAMRSRYMPPVEKLAKEHGVCARTIRRDLAVIEELVPVRWRMNEDV